MTRSMPTVARAGLALISVLVLLAACASSKPKPQPLAPLTPLMLPMDTPDPPGPPDPLPTALQPPSKDIAAAPVATHLRCVQVVR